MKSAEAFFGWLVPRLERLFDDAATQREVTDRLLELRPGVRWEAGPFGTNQSFFAFSPNLDVDLLAVTEDLARSAPAVPGWTFLSARPRKLWTERSIQLTGDDGRLVEYTLDGWLYYLTSFDDGAFFDVTLVPVGYENRPLDELKYVGSLLVESEIGERLFMDYVDRVNVVLPSELKAFGNAIGDLYPQLMQQIEARGKH